MGDALRWICAGFTNRAESEYDPFGAGHSSTSISAALGMAVARDFKVCPPGLSRSPHFNTVGLICALVADCPESVLKFIPWGCRAGRTTALQ